MQAGSIDQLPSGNWRVRVRQTDGSRITLRGPFTSEDEARLALAKYEARMLLGVEQHEERRGPRFHAYALNVLDGRDLRPRTLANYRSLLRTALGEFSNRPVTSLTPYEMRTWWAAHRDHPVNRRNALWLLRVVMAAAVRDRLIERDPSEELNGGAVAKERPTHTVAEFRAVMEHIPPSMRTALEVKFAGHLRLGELLALNVEDYDRKAGRILIAKAVDAYGRECETKTGQHRSVTLLASGRAALETYLGAQSPSGQPLFLGQRGGRLPRATLRKAWIEACAAAGIADFHLHDLRHVSLTAVAQAGVGLKDLQHRGGHASVTAAMRYQHTSPERDAEVARMTDERLRL